MSPSFDIGFCCGIRFFFLVVGAVVTTVSIMMFIFFIARRSDYVPTLLGEESWRNEQGVLVVGFCNVI